MSGITYPPELLPIAEDDDDAEVVVVDPDTGKETTVPPPNPIMENKDYE